MNYKKLAALGASLAVAGGMIVSASGATGAYFSQTKSGAITGTVGNVAVSTSGGTGDDHLTFAWTNMLPGVPNSVTVNYTNTGTANEDIYLQFPNATALSALNDLGTYGAASIDAAGYGTKNGNVFSSTNLRDERSPDNGCLPYGTGAGDTGCNPLRNEVMIASGVPAGYGGSFTFTFTYASKLSGNGPGVFNTYPATDGTESVSTGTSGNGLPFQVVGLQTGAPALVPTN